LLALLGARPAKANLIVNGGFETGDFSGWSVSDVAFTAVTNAESPFVPHSGTYFAILGTAGGLGTLSQTISDTPGQRYTLSMYLSSDGIIPNEFKVQWNGTTLYDQTDLPQTAPLYNLLSFTVQGTGSDTLTLFERNDDGYLALDDVSINLAAVPAPAASVTGLGGLAVLLCAAGWLAVRRRDLRVTLADESRIAHRHGQIVLPL